MVKENPIATLLGSIYNINPTLNSKNPPLTIYHSCDHKSDDNNFRNLNFGGFTCIESDYLYKNYNGCLNVGDYVSFGNVGSYSVVLKPPFILPNFPILELDVESNTIEVIKRAEKFEDVFGTYSFN